MSHSATVQSDEASRPWYRQPWLWFLILFPSMSVGYCIVAITLAITSENSMVVDDYSKQGRGINQSLTRDIRAAELGLTATVSQGTHELLLQLDARESGARHHDYLTLQLFHPTLSDKDRVLQLQPQGGGYYRAQVPGNIEGRWYLDLRDPANEWRIKGEVSLPSNAGFTLRPDETDRG
ncbi:hypothetical protein SAMN05216203_0793 [Marinobacter daqiaonensis]|uniref:Nitrogen fixation protein FixH n=1 Tax=Marinobacter daqiaonensis TaxID=650891 RepID=A0A1I6H2P0_9GAMM|nr:FixH family protein [Marinobacter daqiaonensis]SFR48684.1 hypothetical protein SAMN05216203_0793 [Marinobacter daqiaonensis]